jgi:hypothetical protein
MVGVGRAWLRALSTPFAPRARSIRALLPGWIEVAQVDGMQDLAPGPAGDLGELVEQLPGTALRDGNVVALGGRPQIRWEAIGTGPDRRIRLS